MARNDLWRRAGALAAGAIVLTATVTVSPAASAASNCADVLFVGARGSSEQGPGSPGWLPADADPHGLGAPVLAAHKRLLAQLGARRSVEAISADYPAGPVPTLVFHADEYFTGLGDGLDFVDQLLIARAQTCPDQRIVLAGYSQGAMVMHRAVQRLQTLSTGSRAGILNRLGGVLLFGDGDRVKQDQTTNYGGFHANWTGIGLQYTSQSGSGTKPFGSAGSVVHQICLRNDPVCDSSGRLGDFFPPYYYQHFNYAGSQVLKEAADAVAQEVLSIPLPQPRNVSLRPSAGIPFRHQLQADIDRGYQLQWQVVVPSIMPAGLTLSPGGLITGTPGSTPSGETSVRVRGKLLGQPGRWASATLRWNGITVEESILIAGQGEHSAGPDLGVEDLADSLRSAGYQVTRSAIVPTDLSEYGQVWWMDHQTPPASDVDRLISYAKSGRGLFVTGEWTCTVCTSRQAAQTTINALVVSVGGIGLHPGLVAPPAPVNTTVVADIDARPVGLTTLTTGAVGALTNVAQRNVLFSSQPNGGGLAFAGAWDRSEVVGGGRLVVVMDSNWFGRTYRGANWTDVTANMAFFLSGLQVPPVAPSAGVMSSQRLAVPETTDPAVGNGDSPSGLAG